MRCKKRARELGAHDVRKLERLLTHARVAPLAGATGWGAKVTLDTDPIRSLAAAK